MKFIQDNKNGSCDLVFSENEIEIIKAKGKLHFPEETLRHFGNTLIKIVADWNENFSPQVNELTTHINTKIDGE